MLQVNWPPPPPDMPATWGIGIGVATILVGAALLAQGWRLRTIVGSLAGCAAGVLMGPRAAGTLGFTPLVGSCVGGFCGALIGLAVSAILWSLVVAALAGGVAGVFALGHFLPTLGDAAPTFAAAQAGNLEAWAFEVADYTWRATCAVWEASAVPFAVPVFAVAGAVLVVGLLKRRFVGMVGTAVVGSAVVLAGATLIALHAKVDLWGTLAAGWQERILSGLAYQRGGIEGCLWGAVVFLGAAYLFSLMLPGPQRVVAGG